MCVCVREREREGLVFIQKSFVMYVNCSHGKGIKFIREELKLFAKTHILP